MDVKQRCHDAFASFRVHQLTRVNIMRDMVEIFKDESVVESAIIKVLFAIKFCTVFICSVLLHEAEITNNLMIDSFLSHRVMRKISSPRLLTMAL